MDVFSRQESFANVQLKLAHEIEDSRTLSRGAARETPGEEELQNNSASLEPVQTTDSNLERPKTLLFLRDFGADHEVLWHTITTMKKRAVVPRWILILLCLDLWNKLSESL